MFGKGQCSTGWELGVEDGHFDTGNFPAFLNYLKPICSQIWKTLNTEKKGEVYHCVLNLIATFFSCCDLLPTRQPLFPFLKWVIILSCQWPTQKVLLVVVFRRLGRLLFCLWGSGPSFLVSLMWLPWGSGRTWKRTIKKTPEQWTLNWSLKMSLVITRPSSGWAKLRSFIIREVCLKCLHCMTW